MKHCIVITDGATLNPGDLSWDDFSSIGEINYFDRMVSEEIINHCANATIIITNKTPISEEVMQNSRHLKVIAVTATGYNVVATEAATKRGILVCNVPGYGTDSVAQHTFALILSLTNHVDRNHSAVMAGEWSAIPDFCFSKRPIMELSGKTFGVVGWGEIGKKAAQLAEAFGMRVIYYSPSLYSQRKCDSLESVFAESDIVSLHCPLTKDNGGFVNLSLLRCMKPSAVLVNTARGQLINEADLAYALRHKVIAGAALDVLATEPPPADHVLIQAPNCIITPHTAWLSYEARKRIMRITYDNIVMALKGNPVNQVNL